MSRNKAFQTFSISHRVPHRTDTEIYLSRPESWSESISDKTFSESDGGVAGMRGTSSTRDDRIQNKRSLSYEEPRACSLASITGKKIKLNIFYEVISN